MSPSGTGVGQVFGELRAFRGYCEGVSEFDLKKVHGNLVS